MCVCEPGWAGVGASIGRSKGAHHGPAHPPTRFAHVMRPAGGAYAGWYAMDRSIGDGAARHLDCGGAAHDFMPDALGRSRRLPMGRDAATPPQQFDRSPPSPAPPWPRSSIPQSEVLIHPIRTHPTPIPSPTPTGYVGGPTMAVIAANCPNIRVCVVDISVPQIQVRFGWLWGV